MKILGIETSCDESSVAIVENGTDIIFHTIASQAAFHNQFGGVVPEQAARQHLEKLPVLVGEALKIEHNIDKIAVTVSPGLAPALLVGVSYAKGLSLAMQKPLIEVDHLQAHVYTNIMTNKDITFPHICLLISGGHTQLILVKSPNRFEVFGSTLDDAVGEAYDKVARMFHLGYPGGVMVEELARKGTDEHYFPRPMLHSKDYNFSFSGLKTSVKNYIDNNPNAKVENTLASFQNAAIEVLLLKTFKAAIEKNISTITIAGGVSANSALRNKFSLMGKSENISVLFPPKELCGDNAAMISGIAYYL